MDKDKIDLIKYLSILVVEMFIPPLWLLSILCIYLPDNDIYSNLIALIGLTLIFILPILYLLLPILVTILAIKYHWSTYLDKFFYQLKYPTFIFVIVLLIIFIYQHFHLLDGNHSTLFWNFYYAIIPPYCLIYVVILVHNMINKFRSINNESKK